MGAPDHLLDAAQDLAFTRGLTQKPDSSQRFLRRRVAATLWIPLFMVAILVANAVHNWTLGFGLMALAVAGLVAYAEGLGRVMSWARRLVRP